MTDWSTKTIPNLLHDLNTDLERGLSSEEAARRLLKNGENSPVGKNSTGASFLGWCSQQLSFFILYLGLILLLISPHLLLKEELFPRETMLSIIFVSFVCILKLSLRFYQRQKSLSNMLKIWSASEVQVPVIRDGKIVWISPHTVVQGDLLLLIAGGYIAADARIVETEEMVADESSIFRRSVFSTKTADSSESNDKPITEQKNLLFGGTYVVDGQGRAVVVETGKKLQINKYFQQFNSENTELESDAENTGNYLVKNLTLIGILLSVILFSFYYLTKPFSLFTSEFLSQFLSNLSLVYSVLLVAIPIDLRYLINVGLNQSAYQIFKNGVSIRQLIDVERLSNLTTLCVQQIGNFTMSDFSISHVVVEEEYIDKRSWEYKNSKKQELNSTPILEETTVVESTIETPSTFPWLLWAANQCINHTSLPIFAQDGTIFPEIDNSLHELLKDSAQKHEINLAMYDDAYERVAQLPPTTDYPYTSLLLMANTLDNAPAGEFLQLSFGPIDEILHASSDIQLNQVPVQLSADRKLYISELSRQFRIGVKGLPQPAYTLGFGFKTFTTRPTQEDMWSNLTFLGGIAFRQPNYIDVESSIADCLASGMKIVMISDLSSDQAAEVAYELGLIHDLNAVTTGEKLSVMDEAQYDYMVELLLVYSQTSADQRRNIVQHLKRRHHNIGFWGQISDDLRTMRAANLSFVGADNNVPHLLQHKAGVVVNKSGFGIISQALLKARQAYTNLRDWVRWYLSCVTAQILTVVVGLVLYCFNPSRFPMILNLPQLVWMNLLVIALPSLAIVQNKNLGNLRKYRHNKVPPFMEKQAYSDFIVRGVIISLITLVSYAFAVNNLSSSIQSVTSTTLIFSQLISIFQCLRHKHDKLIQSIQSNLWVLIIALFSIVVQLASIYLPLGQIALGYVNITHEWQWIIPLSILMFLPLNLTHR